MKLIVGLGNPGREYESTRHNIGFMTVDYLRLAWEEDLHFDHWTTSKKFQADISGGLLNGEKIIFAKPHTFMNESGQSVAAIVKFYQSITPLDITVIHDDLDIRFGDIKIQTNHSSAGHNGIKSIIEKLGTQNFHRIRIGIAKESRERQGDAAKFVLHKFSLLERTKLKSVFEKVRLTLEPQI
jgi:PTH1 family peptidyl-tRNA hydrolase